MLTPDWTYTGTKREIQEYFDGFNQGHIPGANADSIKTDMGLISFNGWTETSTDTILVQLINKVSGPIEYRVQVWNQTSVRAELASLLGLPVYCPKGKDS